VSAQKGAEQGSLGPFVAVIAVALVMVAGMAYDGGQIVAAQASARDLAAGAARAAAQEVDLDALRATGVALLDEDNAVAAAHAYLLQAGHDEASVTVDGAKVTVTVHVRQPMRILPVADRTVTATDTAQAVTGAEE
jgi:Flp pilus assembly protein TadG